MIRMSDVWDRSAAIVAPYRARFAAIAVLALFVPFAVQGMAQPVKQFHPQAVSLIGLAAMLVVIWGYGAVQALALVPEEGVGPARWLATRRYLVLIGFTLLALAVLVVALLPAFAVVGLSGIDWQAMQAGEGGALSPASAGAVALAGLWFALVMIAALFVGARMALVAPVVLAERRGLGAIARSWQLTRTLTWKIIGVELLFGLVLIVALLASRFVFGTLLQLVAGAEHPITVATVLTAVVVAGVQTIGTVYILAFFARLYVAARDRHEARPAAI